MEKSSVLRYSILLCVLLNPPGTLQAKRMSYTSVAPSTKPQLSRYGYTGQEKELELKSKKEVYNYRARVFDASLKRFLSPDKAKQQYAAYTYVANNPVNFVDADGLKWYDFLTRLCGSKNRGQAYREQQQQTQQQQQQLRQQQLRQQQLRQQQLRQQQLRQQQLQFQQFQQQQRQIIQQNAIHEIDFQNSSSPSSLSQSQESSLSQSQNNELEFTFFPDWPFDNNLPIYGDYHGYRASNNERFKIPPGFKLTILIPDKGMYSPSYLSDLVDYSLSEKYLEDFKNNNFSFPVLKEVRYKPYSEKFLKPTGKYFKPRTYTEGEAAPNINLTGNKGDRFKLVEKATKLALDNETNKIMIKKMSQDGVKQLSFNIFKLKEKQKTTLKEIVDLANKRGFKHLISGSCREDGEDDYHKDEYFYRETTYNSYGSSKYTEWYEKK